MNHPLFSFLNRQLWRANAYTPPPIEPDTPPSIVLWVATTGDDVSGDGTESLPYATIGRAQEVLRALTGRTSTGGVPGGSWSDGAWIVLKAGTYYLTSTLALDSRDSGADGAPVQIRAATGETVVISGAKPVPAGSWQEVTAVTDATAYARIPVPGRTRIFRLNVNGEGVTPGTLDSYVTDQYTLDAWDHVRLVDGGGMKWMSRHPNWPDDRLSNWHVLSNFDAGCAVVGGSGTCAYDIDDDTVASWTISGERVFGQGPMSLPYEVLWQNIGSFGSAGTGKSRVNVSRKTLYWKIPYADGSNDYNGIPYQLMCVRNALSALEDGTYTHAPAWSGGNDYIFYWSPTGVAPTGAELTVLDKIVTLDGANYIRFKEIQFSGARYADLYGEDCDDISLDGCTIRDSGYVGAEFLRSTNVVLDGGEIKNCAQRAINLHGGNRDTLTLSGNEIKDLSIYDIAVDLNYAQSSAINADAIIYRVGGSSNAACGLLVDNVSAYRLRDGFLNTASPYVTVKDCVIEEIQPYQGDCTLLGCGYSLSNVGWKIQGNTFRNSPRFAGSHVLFWAKVCIYLDIVHGPLIEDNLFDTVDLPLLIASIAPTIVRRNKFDNVSSGWNAAMVFTYRHTPGANADFYIDADLTALPLTTAPWLAADPNLYLYRVSGARYGLRGYHHRPIIVDNMATGAASLVKYAIPEDNATTSGGVDIGIDTTQLNYPIAANPNMPAEGGGDTALSTMVSDLY